MSLDQTTAATTPQEVAVHHAIPILRVAHLATSLDYYTRILGFTIPWQMPSYASVRRGNCSLMLCEGGQGNPGTWIWIAADAERLYDEWTASGATILQGPTNFPWGSREIQVLDPDNHRLRFAADLKPGEPMGQFID
jgi:catechol 2,3-dioxygenase-like lactoylglutathione lyase family enzyme